MHWTLVAAMFRAVCHQIPERCLSIADLSGGVLRLDGAGAPMPLCARCAGIYFGALAALVSRAGWRRNGLLAACAIVAVDVASEAIGLRPAIAVLRVATGFGLGWFAAPSVSSLLTELRT